jgi:argininosuccinate lyase
MSEALWDLSESYSFDHILFSYDIEGSKAHVEGLAQAGLLSADELTTLLATLTQINDEYVSGAFQRAANDEDVHMAIERRATELVGDVGAKIHTSRSRNDQVATALRLYTRDTTVAIARAVLELVATLEEIGEREFAAYLPGYTHLQRAQPVLLSHHLRAHAFALLRDADRLLDARDRMNVSPLGAGALAGTSLGIDPHATGERLGFRQAFANSLDAVSDRDFVAETLFDIALLGVHLSRMGEELVLWTSAEFNFASLGDDFTTGSSMLPQKKNSDVAELARGKSGRLVGNLTGLLVTLKGLPLSYNRDLQEDKEPLFDSVRQIGLVLRALTGAYDSLTFHSEVAQGAANDEFLVATDLAEVLVESGLPFRQAHERVGKLVAEAVASGRTLRVVAEESPDADHFGGLFDERASLERRRSPGGSGPQASAAQGERLRQNVEELTERL